MKTPLVVYHTGGVKTAQMAEAVERVFYPCEGKVAGRPYALFVGAGQDGTGAVTSVERIVTGLRLKKVSEPVVVVKALQPEQIAALEELGAATAAGLAAGIF